MDIRAVIFLTEFQIFINVLQSGYAVLDGLHMPGVQGVIIMAAVIRMIMVIGICVMLRVVRGFLAHQKVLG